MKHDLNVGLLLKETFPQESIEILTGIGEWMKKNMNQSIVGDL